MLSGCCGGRGPDRAGDAEQALDVGRHWIHVTGAGGPSLVSLDDGTVIDLVDDRFGPHRLFDLNRFSDRQVLLNPTHLVTSDGQAVTVKRFGGGTRRLGIAAAAALSKHVLWLVSKDGVLLKRRL